MAIHDVISARNIQEQQDSDLRRSIICFLSRAFPYPSVSPFYLFPFLTSISLSFSLTISYLPFHSEHFLILLSRHFISSLSLRAFPYSCVSPIHLLSPFLSLPSHSSPHAVSSGPSSPALASCSQLQPLPSSPSLMQSAPTLFP